MLAVVNQPRMQGIEGASFRIEGDIPKFVMVFLESAFRDSVKIEENDDSVNVDDWDWFKDKVSSMNAGEFMKAERGLRGWSQKVLAEKLGVSVPNVSEMERGVRAVSRKMAIRLGKIFGVKPERFLDLEDAG